MAGSGKDLVPVPGAVRPAKSKYDSGAQRTSYTQEIAEEICERFAMGELLISICRDEHIPPEYTVRGWILLDAPGKPFEGFAAMYARARKLHVEHEIEELREISDTPMQGQERTVKHTIDGVEITVKTTDMLGHRKLMADTRKWRIAKIAWQDYGDKPGLASDSTDTEDNRTVIIEGGLPPEDT